MLLCLIMYAGRDGASEWALVMAMTNANWAPSGISLAVGELSQSPGELYWMLSDSQLDNFLL